jgi:type IV pilus assembly protein PilQ
VNQGSDFFGLSRADIGFGGGVNRTISTAGTFGPGVAAGMTFGRLINNATLDMKLEAFASVGQIKVVSTPKVLTLNNKQAKITQGTQIPYSTVSAEGTKIEFKAAELTLEVTPHITADGSIVMKIAAKNDSVGTAFASGPPAINTKQATTEMLVKNGETTVIGGIYLERDSDADAGVPFLMDIPLLGGLFKSNQKQKNRSELLIFITPKIVM